jgi:prepilin-type N-terminal cleavage/methylation domain-containing protein
VNRGDTITVAQHVRTLCRFRTVPDRIQGRPRTGGFTLVELMLVVATIGIVASIAAPSLSRARAAAVEVSTIGSLRMMNTAQASYAASCGGGSYAPSVVWLTRPPTGGRGAFIGPEFTANSVERKGYRIRFTAGPRVPTSARSCNGVGIGQGAQSYFVAAAPIVLVGGLRRRYFGTSTSGIIYESRAAVRAFYSGAAAAPAKPIQ